MIQLLGPGDDLWILLENSSAFFQRIDWLTHFLISHTLNKQPVALSPVLLNLQKICKLPNYSFAEETNSQCVLIDTSKSLPTHGVLYFPITESNKLDQWQKLFKKIKGLNVKTSRIFLPPNYKVPEIKSDLVVHYFQLTDTHLKEAWTWS